MNNPFSVIIESLDHIGSSGKYVRKRDSRVSILDVYAAKEINSGLEALLVETKPNLLTGIDEWPQSEGFTVEIESVEGTRPGTATRICLLLSDKRFLTVFITLGESICNGIQNEQDPRNAIKKIHDLLLTWQQFHKKNSPDGLSEHARVGLFGELEILKALFFKNLNNKDAIQGWRGCRKAHQDFQYIDFALEVKTTRAVTPETISISNIRQLDDENINKLFLTVVNVEQNPTNGTSLQMQVSEIKEILNGSSIGLFEEGLDEVGFIEGHTKLYESELYTIQSINHYAIADGFPRILRSHIAEGVKHIKYKISLGACNSYQSENSLVLENIKKLKERIENE